jgi:hypothetical protein
LAPADFIAGGGMATGKDFPLGRRQFIGGAGAAMLGGCVSCPPRLTEPWAPATNALADVHAHFFNMSDLPIEAFIRHVLIPNRAPGLAGAGNALAEIAGWLKRRSPTIEEERRGLHLGIAAVPEREVSAERFSREVADFINRNAPAPQGANFAASASARSQGFAELAALIGGATPGSADFAEQAGGRVAPAQIEQILLGEGRNESATSAFAPEDPCATQRASCVDETCDEPVPAPLPLQADRILTALKWVWDMMQGRCNHVREYLQLTRSHSGESWRPGLVVHHLVDYDSWLADDPEPESGHQDQIRFWSDYSAAHSDEIQLLTFGGYDPLKHAEQRLSGSPPLFDFLTRCYAGGTDAPARIHGFKLYPPMGFKPSGNRADDYRGTDRARGIVSGRWQGAAYAGHDVGAEINRSLALFYDFCLAHDAPILSHSIPGNQAACCFGQRADPAHWIDLMHSDARYRRLRLCLGHGIAEADCFVHAVEAQQGSNPPPVPPHVWALHGTRRLLEMSRAGQANVYADIGYLSELLRPDDGAAATFAVRFFAALKWYCERYDPECRRLLFGTDWIMIGQELRYRRYVDLALHGMAGAGWPASWQHNLLHGNIRDFLKLPAA